MKIVLKTRHLLLLFNIQGQLWQLKVHFVIFKVFFTCFFVMCKIINSHKTLIQKILIRKHLQENKWNSYENMSSLRSVDSIVPSFCMSITVRLLVCVFLGFFVFVSCLFGLVWFLFFKWYRCLLHLDWRKIFFFQLSKYHVN